MSSPSLQLARLWVALVDVQDMIDNGALPLAAHLDLKDPELIQALETLSARIVEHWRAGKTGCYGATAGAGH